MRARQPRQPRPPVDEPALRELALAYVARFATSRSKLSRYLRRKLMERGWAGSGEAPVDAIVEQAAAAGFVDDPSYALAKARSLGARGYGERRVAMALREAGIGEEDAGAARDHARETATEAALRYARRRRLGPFAEGTADPRDSAKALAAMMRAGHPFDIARRILALPAEFDSDT
jgi:regulatory protein